MALKQLCAIRMPTDPMEGFSDLAEFRMFREKNCNLAQDNLNDTQAKVLMTRLYEALLGSQPEPATLRQYHFCVTILYLFLTINICRVLRLLNSHVTPTKLRPLTGDVISTFQTISCGFENGFTRKVYGMGAYCCQTFCLGLWSQWTVGKETSGNPVTNFKHFFVRKYGFARTLIHMTAQMLAGLVAYRYASQFWSLRLSPEHESQLISAEHCQTDLNVPVFLGFFIELSATIIDTVVSRTTTKRFMFEHYEQFAKGVFSIWMTIMGLNLTGMYLNPANSTARNFGCSGVTRLEFILVYWLGPIIGSAIGIVIHQNFRSAMQALHRQFFTVRQALCSQTTPQEASHEKDTTRQVASHEKDASTQEASHEKDTTRQVASHENDTTRQVASHEKDASTQEASHEKDSCDHSRSCDDSGFVDGCQTCSTSEGGHLATISEHEKKIQ